MPDLARSAVLRGPPENYLTYATVGIADETPMYARVENGAVLIEVTCSPSGDEIVVRLPTEEPGFYSCPPYGAHVVVGFPGGDGAEGVILCRVSDQAWPFPATVADIALQVPVTPIQPAPQVGFWRTEAGELLLIESGEGADLLIKSGGSARLSCGPGEQILLAGRTHLGGDFATPPTPDTVGPRGETVPGAPSGPYVAVPYAPVPYAPGPLPPDPLAVQDGIVRVKDPVQSDITVDPAFWAWATQVAANPFILAFVAAPPPTALGSHHKAGSPHTASD